jgi:hypothetical protein
MRIGAPEPPIYGLEVRYNDNEPIRGFGERGEILASLRTCNSGRLELEITVKRGSQKRNVLLERIVPGDKFEFTYLVSKQRMRSNLNRLSSYSRPRVGKQQKPKLHLGLDFKLPNGVKWRTSHPKNGWFRLLIGNIPVDHARAFVMAANEEEYWHWQLWDLRPGEEAVEVRVVETNWCDDPPIRKRNDESHR